jgi:hypothetical protein
MNLRDISLCLTDDFLLVQPLARKLKFLNELANYSGNSIRLRKILIKCKSSPLMRLTLEGTADFLHTEQKADGEAR